MQTLRKGSTGLEVRTLQDLLNIKGFNLVVDGSFGLKTEDAVKDWQRNLSLGVDGVVGSQTWASLGVEVPPVQVSNITTFSLSKDGEVELTPNFKVREFACKDGSDAILIDVDFIQDKLQKIREHFNNPTTIVSAYRTLSYNRKKGSKDGSYHIGKGAIDFSIKGIAPKDIAKYCEELGIKCIILYKSWVHIDPRTKEWWALGSNYTGSGVKQVKTFKSL